MIVPYLLFIGSGLYLISSVMFLYLFMKTTQVKDGIGLSFLRIITFGNFLGSLTIFLIRVLSEYWTLDFLVARAVAVINPILLVGMALYLNYRFNERHRK